MITTILSFTSKGAALGEKLKMILPDVRCYSKYACKKEVPPADINVKEIVGQAFLESDTILFIGAAGIAVRLIAPYITSKDRDPAVLVMDENADFIIPILSGHLGGANKIACLIAERTGAQAVITTATDINGIFAVDVWAKEQNLRIQNIENIKYISSALLRGEKIGFACDYEVEGGIPDFLGSDTRENGIEISQTGEKEPFLHTLHLTPRNYVLGLGCRKNVGAGILEEAILQILQKHHLSIANLVSVATIDLKAEEPAIRAFCDRYKLKFMIYSSGALAEAEGSFTSSEFVQGTVGVDNVCERAAYLASDRGEIVQRKTCNNGVTTALARTEWRCRF